MKKSGFSHVLGVGVPRSRGRTASSPWRRCAALAAAQGNTGGTFCFRVRSDRSPSSASLETPRGSTWTSSEWRTTRSAFRPQAAPARCRAGAGIAGASFARASGTTNGAMPSAGSAAETFSKAKAFCASARTPASGSAKHCATAASACGAATTPQWPRARSVRVRTSTSPSSKRRTNAPATPLRCCASAPAAATWTLLSSSCKEIAKDSTALVTAASPRCPSAPAADVRTFASASRSAPVSASRQCSSAAPPIQPSARAAAARTSSSASARQRANPSVAGGPAARPSLPRARAACSRTASSASTRQAASAVAA
mmetsp:Transcript_118215/g.314574  ORF Transcript_118215/g.314574 Transcript_118215/m.314574 type:complete len:313 (-) Transcript_118215:200-1138(-)